MPLVGCDFSSSPSRQKPIVLALGSLLGERVRLSNLKCFPSLPAFGDWLKQIDDWVGGFDLPFGLPRELVTTLGWPDSWEPCVRHYGAMSRVEIRRVFADFCNARPVGGKFAHRATDGPAGSSPSMRWVNPPVAYMLHAGIPLLLGRRRAPARLASRVHWRISTLPANLDALRLRPIRVYWRGRFWAIEVTKVTTVRSKPPTA